MIEIRQTLPQYAVLGPEVETLSLALKKQSAHWFRALNELVAQKESDGQRWVQQWFSATSEAVAEPTRPNDKGGRFDDSGPISAMRFREKMHGGFSVEPVSDHADRFSVAVIYHSENRDARSLFSVGGKEMHNILFANEVDGVIRVQDRKGAITQECEAPEPSRRFALLVVSYEKGKLRVALNNRPAIEINGDVPGLSGAAKLFIGCRNHRPGLIKTLGNSLISDVVFWPDRMVLSPSGIAADPSLEALRSFWRWNR